MGAPYFKEKQKLQQNGVKVFSSNYELYADLSRRIVTILRRFSPQVEQYSIDESFLLFDYDQSNIKAERQRLTNLALEIRQTVLKATGIPVRVSIAETKTLAKAGSEYAKVMLRRGAEPCICFWEHPDKDNFISQIAPRDVWGIGRAKADKLQRLFNINTATQLRDNLDERTTRSNFSIITWRTILELRGIPCLELEHTINPRKSLIRSRMFGAKINDPSLIAQALSTHVIRSAEKLRHEGLIAGGLIVFVTTGKHPTESHMLRRGSAVARLPFPTNDSLILNKWALQLLPQAYLNKHPDTNENYRYSKCGVILTDIIDAANAQENLFGTYQASEKPQLMQVIDHCNRRHGQRSLVFASMGTPAALRGMEGNQKDAAAWAMNRNMKSPRYTTNWQELIQVK